MSMALFIKGSVYAKPLTCVKSAQARPLNRAILGRHQNNRRIPVKRRESADSNDFTNRLQFLDGLGQLGQKLEDVGLDAHVG
ncbi:hypothetical protein, partial [Desulfosarcina cetonica]|uniref:hypothetical protein n=1 Tax=Desulfosarcina cetonica TaxID=90730 RepID=UPI001C468B7C